MGKPDMILGAMVDSRDPGRRSKEPFSSVRAAPSGHRPNRHDRLWNFAKLCPEICRAYARDPAKASDLFKQAKREFLAENWTLNHFQSPESRGLLILLASYFHGDGVSSVYSSQTVDDHVHPLRPFNHKRNQRSMPSEFAETDPMNERSWDKDPKVIILLSLLMILLLVLWIIFLGPLPSEDLAPFQHPAP